MAMPLLYRNLIDNQFDQIVSLVDERSKQVKKLKKAADDSNQREKAQEDITFCQMLFELFNYFERYWMNIITPTMFCVEGLQHRTNNSAEGNYIFSIFKVLIRNSYCIDLKLSSFNNEKIIQLLFR
jgi:hypothetical protein